MRLRLLHLAAALAFFSVVCLQARAVDIYVLSGSGSGVINNTTGFGKIDSSTGVYTQISAAVSGSNIVNNLSWNAANSAFYVTEGSHTNATLRTLSLSGTLSNSIGTIGTDIYGMAYRPVDGTLYAYDFRNNKTGTLNLTNGSWSDLNPNTGQVALSPVGGRYAMLNDTIYASVNFSSGQSLGTFGFTASSTFSQIGVSNPVFQTMSLASDGTSLYGVIGDASAGSQKLYSVNPTTGVATFLNNISGSGLGNYFYGASIVTAVPEPSTYALGAIATGVMAYVARRRKVRKA